jgi:hypothetical protein
MLEFAFFLIKMNKMMNLKKGAKMSMHIPYEYNLFIFFLCVGT